MVDLPTTARLHASVNGRVQGVGFRFFVVESANRLALTGWVRNRFDGSVEVIAEGPRAQLDTFIQDLHRGPRASRVDHVDLVWSDSTGEFSRFNTRMTG